MRSCRKCLLPAVVLSLVAGASALAAPRPSALVIQADREARLVVGKEMAARHPELLEAYQRLAEAVGPLNDAQAEVNQYQAQRNALEAPLQEALRRTKEWADSGQREGNILWLTPNAKYMLEQWERKLDDLSQQVQTVEGRLRVANGRLDDAYAEYQDAAQSYTEQLRAFQAEFDQLYQPEFARRLKALQGQAAAARAKHSEVFIVVDMLPGEYTWKEGGKDVGKVQITAEGGMTGIPPGARDGIWQVTDEGLAVSVGAESWLFKPGPMYTFIGSCKEEGSTIAKRNALLQPAVPPDPAAYKAALQKLKDAAAQKAQMAEEAAATAAPGAAAGAATHVLKIEALVDGEAWLVLQGNKVHWENKSYSVPGTADKEHPDGPYPTLLDGKEWQPVWKGQVSDPTDLPFALPADLSGVTARVKALQGRSEPTVLVHGDSLLIGVNDLRAGADRYVLELSVYESAPASPPQPAAVAQPAAAPVSDSPVAPPAAGPSPQGAAAAALQARLSTPVTLRRPYPASSEGAPTDQISLQYAVIELARQAGLGYNWDESYKNTNPACRKWVYPDFSGVPFAQAMDGVLGPEGLAYDVVNGQVVLRRR